MEDIQNSQLNGSNNETPEGITEIIIEGKKIQININEINLILENTIQNYFKKDDYSNFTSTKNLLYYFYINEKECLNKINSFPKHKKKFYKLIIYDSIKEIFKQSSDKLVSEIFENLDKIRKHIEKNEITIEEFYKLLEEKMGIKDVPKFLIKNDIKYIKMKEKMNKKEQNSPEFKKILEYYKKLINGTIPPFNLFKNKNILFNIFVLSNVKDIGTNKLIEDIFFENYCEIRSWFGLTENLEDYQNVLINFVFISDLEIKTLLESFSTQINIEFNDKNNDLFFILISSFFYCIMNKMKDLNNNNDEINGLDSYCIIFLKNIIETLSIYINPYKYNIKLLINFLYKYALSNKKNNINTNIINNNSINNNNKINIFVQEESIDYDLFLIEEIINHFKDNNLKERFKQIKSKFKLESFQFSKSFLGTLFQKISDKFTSNFYYYSNFIRLIPFQKYINSNTITILISGFGSESDDYCISWKNFIENNPINTTYYFYQWPGDSFIKIIIESLPLFFGKVIFDSNLPGVFHESKEKAKYSGKLLSIILQSKKFFGNDKKINLVGFSLGSHIIKNCIKDLDEYKDSKNIINDVILLGGATTFNNKLKWYKRFTDIVGGRIINCYSNEDQILKKLYVTGIGKEPIGKNIVDINDGIGGKNIIENFDFSDLLLGHLNYRENFDLILKRIYGK